LTRVNRVAGRTQTHHRHGQIGYRDTVAPNDTPGTGRDRHARPTQNPTDTPGTSAQDRGTQARRTPHPPVYIDEPELADVNPGHEPGPAGDAGPPAAAATVTIVLAELTHQILLTPEQAGALLAIPGSWLRVRAAAGQVPSRRLGKHLRFARADLDAIAHAAARPTSTPHQATSSPTAPSGVERRGPRRRIS
jgi:hypothetical protein